MNIGIKLFPNCYIFRGELRVASILAFAIGKHIFRLLIARDIIALGVPNSNSLLLIIFKRLPNYWKCERRFFFLFFYHIKKLYSNSGKCTQWHYPSSRPKLICFSFNLINEWKVTLSAGSEWVQNLLPYLCSPKISSNKLSSEIFFHSRVMGLPQNVVTNVQQFSFERKWKPYNESWWRLIRRMPCFAKNQGLLVNVCLHAVWIYYLYGILIEYTHVPIGVWLQYNPRLLSSD